MHSTFVVPVLYHGHESFIFCYKILYLFYSPVSFSFFLSAPFQVYRHSPGYKNHNDNSNFDLPWPAPLSIIHLYRLRKRSPTHHPRTYVPSLHSNKEKKLFQNIRSTRHLKNMCTLVSLEFVQTTFDVPLQNPLQTFTTQDILKKFLCT